MEDNSKGQENIGGISSFSKNENNLSQKFYDKFLDKNQPNINLKENNDSDPINLTFDFISKIVEEMINKLLEFSETLKSEIETNINETTEEIKNEQNSKYENLKKIYSVINNYNIEINKYFNDIKNKIIEINPSYSIEEINIKDKIGTITSNVIKTISSIHSNYNINSGNKSFKEIINSLNENSEKGKIDKYLLEIKTQIFIKEIYDFDIENTFLLGEIKKFLEKESYESQKEDEKFNIHQSSNTNNSYSTNEIVLKEDKTLFDVISELFKEKKYELAKELLKYLDDFGITEEYQGEIFKNFNSKIKKLYDTKNDGDNLFFLMNKIFGKKNLVAFSSLSSDIRTLTQIVFIKGKLGLVNNNFNFSGSELIMYGDYENINGDNSFLYFKPQNSSLYIKIDIDCIYIIFYGQENIRLILKIRNNFIKNPVIGKADELCKVFDFLEENSKDKVAEVFNIYKAKEVKVNELLIYEMLEE